MADLPDFVVRDFTGRVTREVNLANAPDTGPEHITREAAEWNCEAYGPEGAAHGALCFFADQGVRRCLTAEQCHTAMSGERERVYGRIHELAAEGDETGTYLAALFTSPEQILGGSETPDSDEEDSNG